MTRFDFYPSGQYERAVTFAPAWDRRSEDPSKNYGVSGVRIVWVLRGALGAVDFTLHSGWSLPVTRAWWKSRGIPEWSDPSTAHGVSFHARKAVGEFPGYHVSDCLVLGGECWGDGSGCAGDEAFEALIAHGDDGVWGVLERFYGLWLVDRQSRAAKENA